MNKSITFVALDAHKKEHRVAVQVSGEEPVKEWTMQNTEREIRRAFQKIAKKSEGPVYVCYEAGPCGFNLQREIGKYVDECVVIAPSLIPRKLGDRVKTDRRDARELLELFQAGLLMPIWVPNEEEEAVRDLCRCREAAMKDLNRMRHRLGDFLLRQGYHYNEGNKWTQRHMAWLRTLKFENAKNQYVFNEYLSQVVDQQERVKGLDKMMQQVSEEEAYKSPVSYLKCFYGIDTVTALNLVSELYAVQRFESPRQLMSFVGLTPSEYFSGDKKCQGGITKAGNARLRRLLIEAAWQ